MNLVGWLIEKYETSKDVQDAVRAVIILACIITLLYVYYHFILFHS